MLFLPSAFIFILGTIFGSFANVLIDRLPFEKSIGGRSKCEKCHHTLSGFELIPLLSYVVQRGRCRHCSSVIPPRLLFVELLNGLVWVLLFYLFGFSDILLFPIFTLLICMSLTDLENLTLPFSLVGLLIILSLTRFFILNMAIQTIYGGLISLGLFSLIYLLTKKRGIGFADLPFVFALSLLLEWPDFILMLWIAFVSGALVGIILLRFKRQGMKDRIPFGPFLVLGTVLTFFYSQIIWRYLLNLVG